MATTDAARETGFGLAVALSLLSVGGALVMYLNPGDPLAGWGFALAMLAGALAVTAIHVY